jgi:hypothetical protein
MTTRSRFLMLLAIVATLALALVGAGCGGDGEGGSSEEDAGALLERAFNKQVTSADLELDLKAELDGLPELRGPLTLSLSGPYGSDDPKELPVLDWNIVAKGAGQSYDVGLKVTEDNAFVEYQGESYEAGTQLFDKLKQQYAASQPEGQPTLKSLGLDPSSWLEDGTIEDGEDIGGDPTRTISGSVDIEKVIKDFIAFTKSDLFRRQAEAQGQPLPDFEQPTDEEIKEIEDQIDELTLEVDVDDNDIARRLLVQADFTVPEDEVEEGDVKGGTLSISYALNDVGVEPDVQAPANPKPFSELIQQLGPLLGGGLASPTP